MQSGAGSNMSAGPSGGAPRRAGHSRNASGTLMQARTLARSNSQTTDDQLFPNNLTLRGLTNTIEALRELVPFANTQGQPQGAQVAFPGGSFAPAPASAAGGPPSTSTSPQASLQQLQLQLLLQSQQHHAAQHGGTQAHAVQDATHASSHGHAHGHSHAHGHERTSSTASADGGASLRRAVHLRSSASHAVPSPTSFTAAMSQHGPSGSMIGQSAEPAEFSVEVELGAEGRGSASSVGGGFSRVVFGEDDAETPLGEQEGAGGGGDGGEEGSGGYPSSRISLDSIMQWAYRSLPFVLILLLVFAYRHKWGICVNVWLSIVLLHSNYTIVKQVGLKEQRSVGRLFLCILTLALHGLAVYYYFRADELYYSLMFYPPPTAIDLWTTLWIVCISDTVAKYITMVIKCFVVMLFGHSPPYKRTAQYYSLIEHVSQLYRVLLPIPVWYTYLLDDTYGQVFSHLVTGLYLAVKITGVVEKTTQFWFSWRAFVRHEVQYGQYATKEQIAETDNTCAICQEDLRDPVSLHCKHIFCEDCVSAWLERERTCPLCRATVQMAGKRVWRDGSTSCILQVF